MIEQIRPLELSSWLSRHRGEVSPVVLDVREPSEWRTASVQPGDFTLLNMSMGTVPRGCRNWIPEPPSPACVTTAGAACRSPNSW